MQNTDFEERSASNGPEETSVDTIRAEGITPVVAKSENTLGPARTQLDDIRTSAASEKKKKKERIKLTHTTASEAVRTTLGESESRPVLRARLAELC